MGYDISIRKFYTKDEEESKIDNKEIKYDKDIENDKDKIENPCLSNLTYDELHELTEEVATLYMTYNHCQLFQEYDIYPRYFNNKKVKDILPAYLNAFNKLFKDEEVDKELAREYQDFNFDSKYIDTDYNTCSESEYLYQTNKTVIFIVVKAVIKLLIECDPDDIWLSD